MPATIRFRLNGQDTTIETEGTRSLLWVLRTDLNLTGTKYGCGIDRCGSCTVLVDGRPRRACQLTMDRLHGAEVVTIEGLAAMVEGDDTLHPLQEEFAQRGGFQCGFCTPGMIMEAVGLLNEYPRPSRRQILVGLNRNLCRCGAHKRIVEAVEAAAARM